MEFINHPYLLLLVAVISWPVYKTLGKICFGDYYEDLGECIKYIFQPDWYSLLKGQYWADRDATFKFFFFLGVCIGWIAAVTDIVCRIPMSKPLNANLHSHPIPLEQFTFSK